MVDLQGLVLDSIKKLLDSPRHLSVDIHDNVLVADSDNNRVQLLSPTLTYLGDIKIPGHQLNDPHTLHFDQLNHRLYIGEWTGECMFVLDVDVNDNASNKKNISNMKSI